MSLLEQVKGNVAKVEPSSGDYHDNISLIKQKVRLKMQDRARKQDDVTVNNPEKEVVKKEEDINVIR